jgi:hypothetical protein
LEIAEKVRAHEEAAGLLVPKKEVWHEVAGILRLTRDSLLNLPTKQIPILGPDGPYVADQLRRGIEATLHDLCDRLQAGEHLPPSDAPLAPMNGHQAAPH